MRQHQRRSRHAPPKGGGAVDDDPSDGAEQWLLGRSAASPATAIVEPMITTEADFTACKEAAAPSPPRTGRGCRVVEPFTELPAWLTDVPDHAVLLIYRVFLDCLNPR